MKAAVVLALIIAASNVTAKEVNCTWDAPTLNTDGTQIESDLTYTVLVNGTVTQSNLVQRVATITVPNTGVSVTVMRCP